MNSLSNSGRGKAMKQVNQAKRKEARKDIRLKMDRSKNFD